MDTIVLLIEDNNDDAFLFERAAKQVSASCRVLRVSDGQQAIEYLAGDGPYADRTQFPLPHLLLVDLKMPRCDGFQFLEWKRGQRWLATTPAIVMTSSALDSDIRRSYELGANSFTCKEGTLEQLRERIAMIHHWWMQHCRCLPPKADGAS